MRYTTFYTEVQPCHADHEFKFLAEAAKQHNAFAQSSTYRYWEFEASFESEDDYLNFVGEVKAWRQQQSFLEDLSEEAAKELGICLDN